jgi:hypothetical protein
MDHTITYHVIAPRFWIVMDYSGGMGIIRFLILIQVSSLYNCLYVYVNYTIWEDIMIAIVMMVMFISMILNSNGLFRGYGDYTFFDINSDKKQANSDINIY